MDFNFERLMLVWKQTYYIEPLTIVFALFFLTQLLKVRDSRPIKSIIIFYFISICILFISSAATTLLAKKLYLAVKGVEILNMWFNGIEVFVFYKLFVQIIYPMRNSKLIKYILYGLMTSFLLISILFIFSNVENYTQHYRPLLKLGEIIDVLKRCIICIPCIYYFLKIFDTNKPFQLPEVMVVFGVFCYSVLGILSYSIGANISEYKHLKRFIMTFPAVALLLLCSLLTSYLIQKNKGTPKMIRS
jgi:hypothetical protein